MSDPSPAAPVATAACASEAVLARVAAGDATEDERAALHEHLDECGACMAAMLALVQGPAAPRATPALTLDATRLGRFELRTVLGSGGMGTVFTAWDPQLEREVAIKVLRPDADAAREATRLLREAKAMAQVRHPCVVTVFEVGQDRDVIYVAMERITGATLRAAAIDARPAPDFATRLGWLRGVADGLVAVHAAGLIHRDLKPDNVFVEGARAVVGDFGLAATVAAPIAAPGASAGRRASATAIGTRFAGTPAYMPPEQLAGQVLDGRADVFAFGVTGWEVLTGARPFAGRTAAALDDAIQQGPPRAPALGGPAAALALLLQRCMGYDRETRPPSMVAVRDALDRIAAPRRRRRWWLAGATGAALLGGGAVAWGLLGTSARAVGPTCDAHATPGWEALQASWTADASALRPRDRERVAAAMTARAEAWRAAAPRGCAGDVLAQQAWSMCRTRVEAAEQAVLEVARTPGQRSDAPLSVLIDELEQPSACLGLEAAEDAVALARLPGGAARAAVVMGLTELVRARAWTRLGDRAATARALDAAARHAAAASPSLLDGELQLAQAELTPPEAPAAQVDALKAAAAQAARTGRASLGARAWLALAERAHDLAVDPATLDAATTQADWAIARLGEPPRLRVRHLFVKAARQDASGDRSGARATLTAAQALVGDDPLLQGARGRAVGQLAALTGDPAQAERAYRELLDDPTFVATCTPLERVTFTTSLAEALLQQGKLGPAQLAADQAVALASATPIADPDAAIIAAVVAAAVRYDAGEPAVARPALERALAQVRELHGPDHLLAAQILERLAQVYLTLGERTLGLEALRECVRIGEARDGKTSASAVFARLVLADQLLEQGDAPAAVAAFTQAAADGAVAFGPDHPLLAQFAAAHARALAATGAQAEAVTLLEGAVAALTAKPFDPALTADVQFELARQLPPSARPRARALAEAALAGASPDVLPTIKAWLARAR